MKPQDIVIDPEFRALIPPLKDEERHDLEAGLKADGCLSPLIVWREQRILLDGHNRRALCLEHGIEFDVRTISLASREAAKAWVIRNQLGRRNLNESQRAMLAADLAELYAEEAKARQAEGQRAGGRARHGDGSMVANLPPSRKARDQAAAEMNVSPRLVQAARKVREKGSEKLQQAVQGGTLSVSAAAGIAHLPKPRQDRLVANGPREVVRAARLARRRRTGGEGIAKDAFTPVRGHSDPPAMVALSLPKANPELAANTLIELFETDWLRAVVERIARHLESRTAK